MSRSTTAERCGLITLLIIVVGLVIWLNVDDTAQATIEPARIDTLKVTPATDSVKVEKKKTKKSRKGKPKKARQPVVRRAIEEGEILD